MLRRLVRIGAWLVNAAAVAVVALVVLSPWWEPYVNLGPVDVCLDLGYRWNYEEDRCDYESARSPLLDSTTWEDRCDYESLPESN